KIKRHPRFQHHTLRDKFIFFGRECDITNGLLFPGSANVNQALYKFPGNAVYDSAVVVVKHTDWCNQACGSHSSQKPMSFDKSNTGTSPRCCDRGNKSGRASATNHDVIICNHWNFTYLCYFFPLLRNLRCFCCLPSHKCSNPIPKKISFFV